MKIRKAFIQDIEVIMRIYEDARAFMRSIGNGSQWGDRYTIVANIENDSRRTQSKRHRFVLP